MKKFIIKKQVLKVFVFVLSFIVGSVLAQTLKAQPSENSLLWKIEGEGIKESYLFGTFHILPQSEFELKHKVSSAFSKSEQLVMELKMDNPNLQGEIMQNIGMKNGLTINELIDEKDYTKLDEVLTATIGAGLSQLNNFKPFMISSLLIGKIVGEQPASFETALGQMASAQEVEIIGLETVKEQMQVFDEIPYQNQANDLMEMINDEKGTRELFVEMIRLYREEKLHELYSLTEKYFDEPGELETVLSIRNQKWIPLMVNIASEKHTFFAVGAGHLGGEQGLLSLFKKQGYTLTAIL